jgi:photosystem II stability/assembly factor-like uncharacterized protein
MTRNFALLASITMAVWLLLFLSTPPNTASAIGQGWSHIQSLTFAQKPATLNALFYDGETLWIVGGNGLLLRSEDDGSSFTPIESKWDTGLNDVIVKDKRIWIVGDQGKMLHSTDGGASFIKNIFVSHRNAESTPLDLYSVQFLDKSHGYIVGDQGLILSSSDGGLTWEELPSGTKAQLFHLAFRGKRGWVVGSGGTILHTDDRGKNWYPQKPATTQDLNRVVMVSDDTGFISGNNGVLFRTEDAGSTWQPVNVGSNKSLFGSTESLFGISFLDKKTGWVVGYKGVIFKTSDGGHEWIEQSSSTSADLFAVSMFADRGFVIGRGGIVLRY